MKKILLGLILIMILIVTSPAYAAGSPDISTGSGKPDVSSGAGGPDISTGGSPSQSQNQTLPKIGNPLNASSIQDVIFLAVDIAIYVGTAFAILSLIFVGFKFVEAQGSDEKLKDAKKWFFYIIIGFAILISSKVIVEIVKNTLINTGVVNEQVWNPK